MVLTLFQRCFFQTPKTFARLRITQFGVTISARFHSLEILDNEPTLKNSHAVLPISFSMSSSVTLLLRTLGDPERQLKNTHPHAGCKRISRRSSCARRRSRPAFVSLASRGLAGNTLNRRGDSFRCRISYAAPLRGSNFFMRDPRKPRLRGFFQLLAATFLLRACERGHFFEQKIQLAGKDQIDRRAGIALARA
jgi:hypothetical protein